MTFTKKNEDAVSEVISVILIIAVTLVLAGVIAVLVFGVGSNVPKSKVAEVSLTRNDGIPATSTVTAVFHGGKDAASVSNISFLVGNVDKGGMCMTGTCTGIKVGCQTSFTPGIKPATVTVVGNFADGTKQVLLQQSI